MEQIYKFNIMDYYKFNREEYNRWVSDSGDITLRLNYELDKNSIVIDGGGYKGDWAENISKIYGSFIYIFEPIKKYYNLIENRFSDNNKIKVIQGGLSNKNSEIIIYHSDDASSSFIENGNSELIKIFSLSDFLLNNNISYINLLKINIEGGEYDLLENLIYKEDHKKIENLQIQFHRFIPMCKERRDTIRKELSKTHYLTYDYEFIWENWKIKNNQL